MSDPKPMREWPCPPQFATAFSEVNDLKIEIQKKQDEVQRMAQECQLKFTESWNKVREALGSLGKEHERAVYGACHLSFDEKKQTVTAWEKGQCPICDQQAKEAMQHLDGGQAMGILVSGGAVPPQHHGGVVDPAEEEMRQKRRGRGRLFGGDEAPPEAPGANN